MTTVLLAASLLSAMGAAAEAVPKPGPGRFFVAPDGRDTWSGRRPAPTPDGRDGPFATPTRAVAAVRELRAAGFSQTIEVVLRRGVYYLDAPLHFGPEFAADAPAPVVFRSRPGEEVTISGGRPVADWRKGADGVWRAPAPRDADGRVIPFRQLFVDGRREIRARTPNFDPEHPYTGGWFFVSSEQKPEPLKPGFGVTLVRIHTPGDTFVWGIDVPADGRYSLWFRYGALNKRYGRDRMDGRTRIQVDDGHPVLLNNLPDTGSWHRFEWRKTAEIDLSRGKHRLRWTNVQGGGLNLDALLLTDDPDLTPQGAAVPRPVRGRHCLLVQAESFVEAKAKEYGVSAGVGSRPRWPRNHFHFRDGDVRAWPDSPEPEIHIFPAWGWVNAILSVDHVDMASKTVYVKNRNCTQDLRAGNRYFVENVREALDAPGEWYLDKAAGEVLYIPRDDDFQGRNVVAPVLDYLVEIRGEHTGGSVRRAGRIEFRGLTFRHTRYSLEAESVYAPNDAAIRIQDADHCVVQDCRFLGLGGYAVRLRGTAAHNRICDNEILDGGQGGVLLEGTASSRQPHDNEISGNRIERCGRIWKHVAGVYVTTGSRNRIAFNTILEMPRYGVSLKSYGPDNASHENVVEYNRIERSNLETNDTGAIETLGRDRRRSGNVIRYNLILDVVGLKTTETGEILTPFYTWGIYLDDYSSGTTVYGNIVARTFRGGVHIHLGRDNTVENNVLVDGRQQQFECNGGQSMRNNRFVRNIVVSRTGAMIRINQWHPDVLTECNHNLYWRPGADLRALPGTFPTGTFASWQSAGKDAASVIADPLFVDAARDDYRLRPDSPAIQLGFRPIPVDRIGAEGRRDRDRPAPDDGH